MVFIKPAPHKVDSFLHKYLFHQHWKWEKEWKVCIRRHCHLETRQGGDKCSPRSLVFAPSWYPWEQISLMMGWSTTDWIPLKEGMLIWRILSPLSLKNGKEHWAQWTNSYFKSPVCYQHILQTVTFSPTGPHRHCSCVLLV